MLPDYIVVCQLPMTSSLRPFAALPTPDQGVVSVVFPWKLSIAFYIIQKLVPQNLLGSYVRHLNPLREIATTPCSDQVYLQFADRVLVVLFPSTSLSNSSFSQWAVPFKMSTLSTFPAGLNLCGI